MPNLKVNPQVKNENIRKTISLVKSETKNLTERKLSEFWRENKNLS